MKFHPAMFLVIASAAFLAIAFILSARDCRGTENAVRVLEQTDHVIADFREMHEREIGFQPPIRCMTGRVEVWVNDYEATARCALARSPDGLKGVVLHGAAPMVWRER